MDERYARCARLIARAEGLLVTAGAGIGVDSGLPDFRGSEGMWRAYPALQRAGLRFHDIACPDAFRADPRLAWGFYGHRLKLYRDTVPNAAFAILQAIAQRLPYGAFHARFSPCGDHFSGRPVSADRPSRPGPRHSGQFEAFVPAMVPAMRASVAIER